MELALILFILTYIGLILFQDYRPYIACGSAALYVILGILPMQNVLSAIDWNVILMIAGTMGLVSLFIESKMAARLADLMINKMPDVRWVIVSLAFFASIVSAFIDNVATVLIVAPIAMDVSKKLKISPVTPIIAIAISSNLQGAATLVGDTTSILLGGHANMNFLDFFFYDGIPGLFWITQIAAILATAVLYVMFRKHKEPVEKTEVVIVEDYVPSILLVTMVLLLILVSFVNTGISTINGIICVTLMIIGVLYRMSKTKDRQPLINTIKDMDFFTLVLLVGLFVVIAAISEAGVIDLIADFFVSLGGDNLFLIYTIIVFFSVILSAFIDNIPYIAAMLPVVGSVATSMGVNPTVLYFGLLIGATLGGNLTPIGASANITGIGILRKAGYKVSTQTFMKISVPFTLTAVFSGYILNWLLFGAL